MRFIIITVLQLLYISVIAQVSYEGVTSHSLEERIDYGYNIHVILSQEDSITLKTRVGTHPTVSFYADDKYCCVLSLSEKGEYILNAAYNKNGAWINDYIDHYIMYPSNALYTFGLENIKIINGTKLNATYSLRNNFSGELNKVNTNIILGKTGTYDEFLKWSKSGNGVSSNNTTSTRPMFDYDNN